MTYIITDPCVGTCDTACVEVCPVDCIHGPDDPEGSGEEAKEDGYDATNKQLYINPEECIAVSYTHLTLPTIYSV